MFIKWLQRGLSTIKQQKFWVGIPTVRKSGQNRVVRKNSEQRRGLSHFLVCFSLALLHAIPSHLHQLWTSLFTHGMVNNPQYLCIKDHSFVLHDRASHFANDTLFFELSKNSSKPIFFLAISWLWRLLVNYQYLSTIKVFTVSFQANKTKLWALMLEPIAQIRDNVFHLPFPAKWHLRSRPYYSRSICSEITQSHYTVKTSCNFQMW